MKPESSLDIVAREFEVDDVLGAAINVWGRDGKIVGVVRDFHTEYLHEKIYPVAFWVRPASYTVGAVKLVARNWVETIEEVRMVWERQFPGFILSYEFLDDKIAAYYENERIMARTFIVFSACKKTMSFCERSAAILTQRRVNEEKIASIPRENVSFLVFLQTPFTGIAIFIGAIGLFGLTSYLANTRKKEIGVRKVFGARVDQIISLLSIDFAKLVFISFLLAAPISWYFMNEWLRDFATRIDLSLWMFMAALASSLLITLLTVGYRSLRAAIVNLVDSLKDE